MAEFNLFSLEEEEGKELFLTQQSNGNCVENEINDQNGDQTLFGMDVHNFATPCVSAINGFQTVYSDISDEEDFVEKEKENTGMRYVMFVTLLEIIVKFVIIVIG